MALDFLFYKRIILKVMGVQKKEGFLINHFVEILINVKRLERFLREGICTGP